MSFIKVLADIYKNPKTKRTFFEGFLVTSHCSGETMTTLGWFFV